MTMPEEFTVPEAAAYLKVSEEIVLRSIWSKQLSALRKREAPEWAEPSEPYVLGELAIDYAERRVTLAGRPVQLTAIEYGLLFELSANAGRVMTYDRLLQRVWGLRQLRRLAAGAHRRQAAPPQAGRRRREPHLRLH